MDTVIQALAPAFGAEALKIWGSYAFVLIVLVWTLWRAEKRSKDKEAENATLRVENQSLQDKLAAVQDLRVKDAQHLIELAKTGNDRMVSRYSGDQQQTEMLASMVLAIQDLRKRMPDKANG